MDDAPNTPSEGKVTAEQQGKGLAAVSPKTVPFVNIFSSTDQDPDVATLMCRSLIIAALFQCLPAASEGAVDCS